jgi:hypothetical protein
MQYSIYTKGAARIIALWRSEQEGPVGMVANMKKDGAKNKPSTAYKKTVGAKKPMRSTAPKGLKPAMPGGAAVKATASKPKMQGKSTGNIKTSGKTVLRAGGAGKTRSNSSKGK